MRYNEVEEGKATLQVQLFKYALSTFFFSSIAYVLKTYTFLSYTYVYMELF